MVFFKKNVVITTIKCYYNLLIRFTQTLEEPKTFCIHTPYIFYVTSLGQTDNI